MSEGAGWVDAPVFCRCARSIENFCRIKMVVARASGMDLASILKRNTFLTLGVRPAGGPGSARDGGTEGAPGRGDTGGPGTGGHGGLRDGGPRAGPGTGGHEGPRHRFGAAAPAQNNCGTICGFVGMTGKSRDTKTIVDSMLGDPRASDCQTNLKVSKNQFFVRVVKKP